MILIQIKSGIIINLVASTKDICEKDYIWNPSTCSCKNSKYLASTFQHSVITCAKIIKKTVTKYSNKEKYNM